MWLLCVQPFGSLSGCSRSRRHKEEEVQCSFQAKFRWNHMFIHGENSFLQKCIPCLRICINHVQTCGRCLLRENKETLLNKWWFYCKLFYCLFSLPWKINLGNNIFSNLSKEWNMPFFKRVGRKKQSDCNSETAEEWSLPCAKTTDSGMAILIHTLTKILSSISVTMHLANVGAECQDVYPPFACQVAWHGQFHWTAISQEERRWQLLAGQWLLKRVQQWACMRCPS